MAPSERVVVVGASGFGRECLDVLEALKNAGHALDIHGVIDDRPSDENLLRLAVRNIAYLGTTESWLRNASKSVRYLVGIGDPETRRRVAELFASRGLVAFTAVHPSAIIGSCSQFEAGVVVCAGAVISTSVHLGPHVHVNPHATIGHDSILGNFVSVNPSAVISGEVYIGPGAMLGASSTILQQLSVGAGTTVGAGALVTKSVPGGVVVKGIPGRWDA